MGQLNKWNKNHQGRWLIWSPICFTPPSQAQTSTRGELERSRDEPNVARVTLLVLMRALIERVSRVLCGLV